MLAEDGLRIRNELLPSIHEQELVEVDQCERKLCERLDFAIAWLGEELLGQVQLLPAWLALEQQAVQPPNGPSNRRFAIFATLGQALGL